MTPTQGLAPLCPPDTAKGTARRVGVEVELGHLDAETVADVVIAQSGGTLRRKTQHECLVEGSAFGDVEIYLDTRFRKDAEGWLSKAGLDLAQLVVPLELVTPPMAPDLIPRLDQTLRALAAQGATGTTAGMLLGFGVHLNVEVVDGTSDHSERVLTSFALLEPALRDALQIDRTRRVLPFTQPYPVALVDRLVAERGRGMAALTQLYLDENPTRNSGLDMLPILAHLDPDAVAARIDDAAVSARPAFHYRLPDCRLDEPGWSIAAEWAQWCVIEAAADHGVLSALCAAWLEHRGAGQRSVADWVATSTGLLQANGLEFAR